MSYDAASALRDLLLLVIMHIADGGKKAFMLMNDFNTKN